MVKIEFTKGINDNEDVAKALRGVAAIVRTLKNDGVSVGGELKSRTGEKMGVWYYSKE